MAAGGVVGALARYGLAVALPRDPGAWAWSTLLVNTLGAALLCALLTCTTHPQLRLLLGVGVLGAFTTFSTFSVDALLLVQAGRPAVAAAYVVVSLAALLSGGLLGRRAGRALR